MPKKALKKIYMSSTSQNAGKTTVSLGLYQAFKERGINTAFMKPVGQRYVNVGDLAIDKDSYLIGEVFHCEQYFKDMSPVTIARGFTEKYILHPNKEELRRLIKQSFRNLIKSKDAIICEGTGHAGVGSVCDVSNADVAALLGAKAVIITEGGIGKSIDEIILNKALFDLRKVDIIGVIINKVLPEKYDKVKKIVTKGFANKGLKVIGVIPDDPILSFPTIEQIQSHLDLRLICGKENISNHVEHTIVAAMEPHNMINYLKTGTLVITSGDRVDNILLAVSAHLVSEHKGFHVSGVILTGGLMPSSKIVSLLRRSKIPVLITDDPTNSVAAKIENFICKIQHTDKKKIEEATRLVKRYVDVEAIINGV